MTGIEEFIEKITDVKKMLIEFEEMLIEKCDKFQDKDFEYLMNKKECTYTEIIELKDYLEMMRNREDE